MNQKELLKEGLFLNNKNILLPWRKEEKVIETLASPIVKHFSYGIFLDWRDVVIFDGLEFEMITSTFHSQDAILKKFTCIPKDYISLVCWESLEREYRHLSKIFGEPKKYYYTYIWEIGDITIRLKVTEPLNDFHDNEDKKYLDIFIKGEAI